ncbi:MAG: hypothetical protein M1469_08995 [Bacteroidetes bacterium]|nr:hypothetical protein [Bacteroidota bacterium]
MKTILIHEKDAELLSAWASYLSQDDLAVFTSADALEAAEIVSMVKVDSVVISSNDPATFLLIAGVLKGRKMPVNVVAISQMHSSALQLLLETENFVRLESPFTFGTLEDVVRGANLKPKAMQNALA